MGRLLELRANEFLQILSLTLLETSPTDQRLTPLARGTHAISSRNNSRSSNTATRLLKYNA
jgi:hypothetical protein